MTHQLITEIKALAAKSGLNRAELTVNPFGQPGGEPFKILIQFPSGRAEGTKEQICKAIEDCSSFEDLKRICDERSLS